MKHRQTYPIREALGIFAQVTGVEPARILRRARLPARLLEQPRSEINAALFFDLWSAACNEAQSPDTAVRFGAAMADIAASPAQLAFAASATLAQGIERLALFKPLIAPLKMQLTHTTETLILTLSPSDPALKLPSELARFELAYFLTLFRNTTAVEIIAHNVGIPNPAQLTARERAFCAAVPTPSDTLNLTFRREDAARPLTSANASLLALLEPALKQQLAQTATPLTYRLQAALLEMLPAGQASLAAAANRLNISTRSLQRALQHEGVSFQTLLTHARTEAAQSYLVRGDMSLTEIAYLLGFRDANSFYRAFRKATGQTPNEARQRQNSHLT